MQRVPQAVCNLKPGISGVKIVFMARSLPILPAEVFDYACAMTSLAALLQNSNSGGFQHIGLCT